MKKKFISALVLSHFIFLAYTQQPLTVGFTASGIADSLKKDANAVYRLDDAELEVLSPSKYTLKVHEVVTVLNREGAGHVRQAIWFDKFNSVDDIEVKVYNSDGIEIQKYKRKDFSIENYYDGISLATDDKIMRLSLAPVSYPCTVEERYTVSSSSYVELPDWIMDNASSSVEQFRYIVKVPPAMDVRYRSVNMDLTPDMEYVGSAKVYTWTAKNISVKKIEAGGYEGSRYLPEVQVSPNVFEYEGYKGDFKTWKDFGKWCYSMYDEKAPFTEQRIAEIKAIIKDLPDVDSKIKALYSYMERNTRYVSIQFGIGGFKPFAASFVDTKKYGDCKALTNYMRSLLAVAGIKSYPALINAGYDKAPIAPEFPENVFNHVILCVPRAHDSTWLECTSTNSDAGYLGTFTENKNALLLTENGGFIVPTPQSNYNSNTLTTVSNVFLNAEGGAEVNSSLYSTGSFYELLDHVSKMEVERQNELFVKYLHYKEPDEFHLLQQAESGDNHQLNTRFIYMRLFDFKAGSKFFFPKSVSTLCNEKMPLQDARKIEYVFQYPYKKIDTTVFHLPAGFSIDNLPGNTEVNSDFVSYKRETNFDAASNTIKIISNLILRKNIILPADYKKVSELFYTIQKEEGNKLILKKAES